VADSASAPTIESNDAEKPKPSDPVYLLGESLFKNKCAACHNLFREIVGPALSDAINADRWSDRKKLYAWIRNPEAFMKTDPYTNELQKKYKVMMKGSPELKDSDIDAIVVYITKSAE